MSLRVVIADAHPLVLSGIRVALEDSEDIQIVGEAHTGREALRLVERCHPDLALIDLDMPELDGLTCLEQIRGRFPEIKLVLMSGEDDPQRVGVVLGRGADAYLVKSVRPGDIASALRLTAYGGIYRPVGGLAAVAAGRDPAGTLTVRERSILSAVATGLTTKAISKELWVSEQTVKFHLTNIYRKLEVSNRAAAIRYACEHGLVEGRLAAA